VSDRRFLIAAGTARYNHLPEDQQLPSVADDLARIVTSFEHCGYDRVLPQLGNNPSANDLRQALGDWFTDPSRTSADIVVFYYAGHGERIDGDGHYLAACDARYNGTRLLSHTALAEEEIAKLFPASAVQHALLIVDTCYAEAGITGLSKKASELLDTRRWDATRPRGIHLIAAARSRQLANDGAFAPAFCRALENTSGQLGGTMQPFTSPLSLVTAVNAEFKRDKVRQEAAWAPATPLADDLTVFVPNPCFEPGRPANLDVTEHWLPKARGGDHESEAWYFTGREQALREIVAWLTMPTNDHMARVVTGGPGAGKSAILGRLVLLADPKQRARLEACGAIVGVAADTLPEPGVIDIAVHARGKTLIQLSDEIGKVLSLESASPNELIRVLRSRDERFTIVLDALDESLDPGKVARELLRPLAMLPAVKLLVGSRPDGIGEVGKARVRSLAGAAVEIDLDNHDRYLGPSDIEDYVTQRLLAADEQDRRTPYRERPTLARRVARAVAERAHGVYLVARIVSRTLVDAENPLDATSPRWRDLLPASVSEAFDEFLNGFDGQGRGGLSKETVVDLLRPLAFSLGAGLPRDDLWASLAGAVGCNDHFDRREGGWRIRYVDQDITTLLVHAGPYVVEALEDGGSRYRLYHEALAELLRADTDEARIHARMAGALVVLTHERGGWAKVHPYARRYVSTHLAISEGWDDLAQVLSDWRFLEAKISGSATAVTDLLNDCVMALKRMPADHPKHGLISVLQDALVRQSQNLRRKDLSPLAQLQFQAALDQSSELKEILEGSSIDEGERLHLKWSTYSLDPAYRRTWQLSTQWNVNSPSISADARIGVCGDDNGDVIVLDLDVGEIVRRMRGHSRTVSQCLISADGRRVLSREEQSDHIFVWDPSSGDLLHTVSLQGTDPWDPWTFSLSSDGRYLLTCNRGERKPIMSLWDLERETICREFDADGLGPADCCAITVSGSRAISGHSGGRLVLWNVENAIVIDSVVINDANWIECNINSKGSIALAGGYGTVVVWDLHTGAAWKQPSTTFEASEPCALTADGHRALMGSLDGLIMVWDLDPNSTPRILYGHTRNEVWSIAVSADGKRALSATKGGNTVEWNLERIESLHNRVVSKDWIWSCAISSDGSRSATLSDSRLMVWDNQTGQLVQDILVDHGTTDKLLLNESGSRACVISSDGNRYWNVDACQILSTPDDQCPSYIPPYFDNRWAEFGLEASKEFRHEDTTSALHLDPSGRLLYASASGKLGMWAVDGLNRLPDIAISGDNADLCALVGVNEILVVSDNGTIFLWDMAKGRQLVSLCVGELTCAACSADGHFILIGTGAGDVLALERCEVARVDRPGT
jgi:WD40 repeat protein